MSSVYVHIPFCAGRCLYCDFYSTVGRAKDARKYLECVEKEFVMRKDLLTEPIETIYIGGGTPSMLAEKDVEYLFSFLTKDKGLLSESMEITFEANPEQLSDNYLSFLANNTPINRLSIGVQSFDDKALRLLNRRHNSEQAKEAIKRANALGFENISLDLIFSLPQMTLEDWQKSLLSAISLPIKHISAYCLTVEGKTMLAKMIDKGNIKLPNEEEQLSQFDFAMNFLQSHGFNHYETSNYAKEGYVSRHNSAYWAENHYMGLGAAAHSFNGSERRWNYADIERYMNAIECNEQCYESEILSPQDHYNEYMLTHSRLATGFPLPEIKEKYPKYYELFLKSSLWLTKQGLLFLDSKSQTLKLTTQGWHLQDSIARELFV